ncbi:MAG: hypothetical protein ACF8MF_06725 [Phycisphaerales bacterium JB052]
MDTGNYRRQLVYIEAALGSMDHSRKMMLRLCELEMEAPEGVKEYARLVSEISSMVGTLKKQRDAVIAEIDKKA